MWNCPKCGEDVESTFSACWNCGTAEDGTENPDFKHADEIDPNSENRTEGLMIIPFDDRQIRIIETASRWILASGVLKILLAILLVATIYLFSTETRFAFIAAINLTFASFELAAAHALKVVAQRTGNDQQQIVRAVSSFGKIFTCHVWLIVIAGGIALLTFDF